MGVRQKTLLITGLTLAGLIIILYATSRVILLRSYAELEAQYVRNNVKRALNAFFDNLLTLKQTAEDNAEWDDTYAFMADGKPDYVKSNFPDETFAIMRINFLFLVDTSGAIVFSRGLDLVSNREIPIPPSLQAQLSKDSLLVRHPFEITQSMSELIYLTIQRVKRISQELRPSVLDHLTFPQAVAWQIDEFTKKTGIPCRLSINNEDNLKLTRDVSNALFRVLQETLTNVIRHAEATQVRVELEKTNEHVVLKVQDNGKGMLQQKTSRRNPPKTPRVAELFLTFFRRFSVTSAIFGGKNAFP